MRKIIYLAILIVALGISLQIKSWVDNTVKKNTDTTTTETPATPTPTPTSTTTTILGTFTCLPHAGNPEVITLECAFGLKAATGEHYALDWADNARFNMDLPMDRQFLVTGLLTPIEAISTDQWSKYDIKGIIKVSSYEEVIKDIPVHSVGSSFQMELYKSVIVDNSKITVTAVLEDSRCPADVVCIQAGRAVLALNTETSTGTSTITEITIGQTVKAGSLSITLDSVDPYPLASKKTQDGEYRFGVTVGK